MTNERRRTVAAALIALGAALRLWQFLARGTFWLDEAAIARNVATRSYAELLQPLDYRQIAPKGFLLFEKLATTLFGPSQYAFRLYALLTGLAALPLFYALARRVLDERGALLALAVFALLGRPIYYASEAKQYGGDIFFACLLLVLALRVLAERPAPRHWLRLGAIGAIAVWFSQPAVFVLAGVAIAVLFAISRNEVAPRWSALVAVALWVLSGVPSIWVSLHSLTPAGRLYMRSFWASGFWPLPPHSLADLAWPLVNVYGLFRDALGMPLAALGVGLAVLGAVVVVRQRPVAAIALLAPIGALYLASATRIFPFSTTVDGFNKIAAGNARLVLCLLPALIVIVVTGVMTLVRSPTAHVRQAGIVAAALLLAPSIYYDATALPYSPHDLRPALRALGARARAGDELYVYYGARLPFEWYRARFPIDDAHVALGACHRPGWREYLREVDRQRGSGRLWVLVVYPATVRGVSETDVLASYLDRVATPLGRWGNKDAYALLYDMSRSAPLTGEPASWHPPPRQLLSADTIALGWSCDGVFPGPGIPQLVVAPR